MQRFDYIDSLRGIAILLVIFHHSHPYFAGNTTSNLPELMENSLQHGNKGVTLFFLISAFTLCLSLNNKKETEKNPLRNYLIRRLFRIAPLYYSIIFLILLLNISSPTISSIISNLLFVHGINPYWMNSLVPGGWSVGTEVLFYLIFPFLFFRIKSLSSALILTCASIVLSKITTSIMFKNPLISDNALWGIYVYENIISQLPIFLMGICVFHIQKNTITQKGKSQLNTCYFYIAILLISHMIVGNILKDHYLFAIAFGFVAVALSNYQPKFIVNKFTIWLGKLSYSLYLIHLVIANLLVNFNYTHFSSNSAIDVFIRFTILSSVSGILSYFSHKFIEAPFQAYGKSIIAKLENKKRPVLLKLCLTINKSTTDSI